MSARDHNEPERDAALGELLGRLELPEHGGGYWRALDGSLACESRPAGQAPDAALATRLRRLPLPRHQHGFWQTIEATLGAQAQARPQAPRRWPRIVAAAAVAAAATFLVAAWFGLPGGFDGGVGRALAHVFLPPLQIGSPQATPAKITGNELVWTSRRVTNPSTGVYDVNIFALNVTNGRSCAVSTYPSWKQLVAVGDGKVAWIDGRGSADALYVHDLTTGAETRIAAVGPARAPGQPLAERAAASGAALSGDTVVWIDRRHGDGDVWAYDLTDGHETPVCTDRWGQSQPAVSGDIAVWTDERDNTYGFNGPYYLNGTDIFGRDLATGTTFPICRAVDDQLFPAVSGPIVVWQDGRHRTSRDPNNWDVYARDLRTGREFPIANGPGAQTHPAISGNIVLWTTQVTSPGGTSPSDTIIMGRDLRSGRSFSVSDPGRFDYPAISGDMAVWCVLGRDETPIAVYGAKVVAHDGRVEVQPVGPQEWAADGSR